MYKHIYIYRYIGTHTRVYICIYMYTYICIYIYVYTCKCIWMYVCKYTFTHNLCTQIRIHWHTNMHTYSHTRMHTYIHIRTYTHTHTYTRTPVFARPRLSALQCTGRVVVQELRMCARAVEAAKFSKTSFVVIVYDKISSELNFETFQSDNSCEWAHEPWRRINSQESVLQTLYVVI